MPKFLDQEGVKYLWSQVALEDYPNNETLATILNVIDSTKVDKIDGKELSTNDYTTAEKEKLANISAGAEVNQNAFGKVKIDTTTITADSKTDTLTFVAGNNITLTPDATNDGITITAQDTTYSAAGSSLGLVKSGGDVTIADGIITVNDNSHNHAASNITSGTLDAARLPAASTSTQGAMSAADKTKLNATNIAYGTCSTAAATAAKVTTISGNTNWGLSTGSLVAVKFTYNVPANATLNVNSKGAKPIYYQNKAITAGVINAGNTATFIYNGSQYHLISIDSSSSGDFLEIDITDVDQGTATGINADTLGGFVASDYVLETELDTCKYEIVTSITEIENNITEIKSDISSIESDINSIENNITTNYALKSELPNVPLTSVNGKTGDVVLTADDVGAAVVKFHTLSFPASGWAKQSDGSYTQQVSVSGITASNYAHVDIDMSSATADTFSDLQDAWAMVHRAQSVNGGVKLTAFDGKPEVNLTVKLEVIR